LGVHYASVQGLKSAAVQKSAGGPWTFCERAAGKEQQVTCCSFTKCPRTSRWFLHCCGP